MSAPTTILRPNISTYCNFTTPCPPNPILQPHVSSYYNYTPHVSFYVNFSISYQLLLQFYNHISTPTTILQPHVNSNNNFTIYERRTANCNMTCKHKMQHKMDLLYNSQLCCVQCCDVSFMNKYILKSRLTQKLVLNTNIFFVI